MIFDQNRDNLIQRKEQAYQKSEYLIEGLFLI